MIFDMKADLHNHSYYSDGVLSPCQVVDLASKAKNTPFDMRLVQGVVMRTIIDGRTVFQNKEN